MLRRVAVVLRRGLLAVGVLLLLWLPISFFVVATVRIPPASGIVIVWTGGGALGIGYYTHTSYFDINLKREFSADIKRKTISRDYAFALWPKLGHVSSLVAVVRVPLWLLAAVCLAWPVTSFIVARRRRGQRGFEVDAKGMSNVERPTSNVEDAG